ncbi:MAG: hypothetical protein ACI4DP_02730 [Candidatus Ornithomonoglobus sp.]
MKEYRKPEMNISVFDEENICTTASLTAEKVEDPNTIRAAAAEISFDALRWVY